MACNQPTTKDDHGLEVEGAPLKCGMNLYWCDPKTKKVTRTQTVLCLLCQTPESVK